MLEKQNYIKAAFALSIASLLIRIFAVPGACLSPVIQQHCHGDQGLSNHLCNDPYSPEGRRRDGGAEGGGVLNEAEPAKAGEGGKAGEQQSKAARQKKRKRKCIFHLLAEGKEPFLFVHNKQSSSLKKEELGERSKNWDPVHDNGERLMGSNEICVMEIRKDKRRKQSLFRKCTKE